jgi:hypothetical protein
MYENNQNAKSRKAAVNFFKALLPLLTVSSDDAPKMYATHFSVSSSNTDLDHCYS